MLRHSACVTHGVPTQGHQSALLPHQHLSNGSRCACTKPPSHQLASTREALCPSSMSKLPYLKRLLHAPKVCWVWHRPTSLAIPAHLWITLTMWFYVEAFWTERHSFQHQPLISRPCFRYWRLGTTTALGILAGWRHWSNSSLTCSPFATPKSCPWFLHQAFPIPAPRPEAVLEEIQASSIQLALGRITEICYLAKCELLPKESEINRSDECVQGSCCFAKNSESARLFCSIEHLCEGCYNWMQKDLLTVA